MSLWLPPQKPEPQNEVAFQYGWLEIQDPEKRQAASYALELLWVAMDLSDPPGGIVMPNELRAAHEARWQAYWYIGQMLLGKDCPEREVRT